MATVYSIIKGERKQSKYYSTFIIYITCEVRTLIFFMDVPLE